jgi:hypothetical protein
MSRMSKFIGMTVVTVTLGMGLPTLAFSGTDRTVYDQPEVQRGTIINGKVMNVVKLKGNPDQPAWQVFVKDRETGELVLLHVDQDTTRKDIRVSPDLGDNVIAKYNEQNNHAYSFLTDERDHN